jgi:SAM-dependent methyltransferase
MSDSLPPQYTSSYDPDYFEPLFEIEDRHFWFRTRNRLIATLLKQKIRALPPGFRVLEVGCGTGSVLQTLERVCPTGSVIGMDLYAEGLRYARRRTSVPLVQGDVRALSFDIPFEVIGMFDVLEHLPDDQHVLRHLRSSLTADGVLLLTVPAHRSLWSYFDEASHHCRRYERDELDETLRSAGYEVEYLTHAMSILFPLIWIGRRLSRLVARARGGRSVSADDLARRELRLFPGLNSLLTWLLRIEAMAIGRRIRLPIGTSLVAVARVRSGDRS